MRTYEESCRKCDTAIEAQWHATADLAEARQEFVKAYYAVVSAALAEKPFDPELQERMEVLEEWKKHLPKE